MPPSGDVSFLRQITGSSNLAAERLPLSDSANTTAPPLANPDLANPFFNNMFESEETNFEMPTAVSLVDHNMPGEAYLRYRTGEPFLLALRNPLSSTQQAFVFTTPLRQEFTSLYRHGVFVPIMYRLASLSKSLEVPLYYSVAQPVIDLKTRNFAADTLGESSQTVYQLRHQDQAVIPSQRQVNQRLVMEMPQDVLEAGFYDLAYASEDTAAAPLLTLSFNVDERESQVAAYAPTELEALAAESPHVSLYEADDVETFGAQLQNKSDQASLWKYALLLALLFLLVEVLLIRLL